MLDIKGRWALITGASRGIGRLAALALAKEGCNIILHSRRLSNTEKTENEIKQLGVDVYSVQADLENNKEITAMLEEIDDKTSFVDIVLNNAGAQLAYRDNFYETTAGEYNRLFQINLIAPVTICYHFLPKMIARGFGRIVNTTSGINKQPQQGPYSVSKAALDKFTKDVAVTLEGTDVMLNLTDPGWCATDMGGPSAPNAPETSIPGVIIGVFADDKKSGRLFAAQEYAGLSLKSALKKAVNREQWMAENGELSFAFGDYFKISK